MFVRSSPAVVLSLVLSAAALVSAPSALASDSGTVKDFDECDKISTYLLKVSLDEDARLDVVGSVFSEDEDTWSWKLKHNGDYSASGEKRAKDADRSFRVVRSMVDLAGPDRVEFRAENDRTGELCKGEVIF
ncbi:MAG: hypothetical protein WKF72_06950 [Nocardioidaceae bacterium]